MKRTLLFFACLINFSSGAQYYFNDLKANRETRQQHALMRKLKIKSLQVSIDPDLPTEKAEILLTQEFSLDGKKVILYTNETSGNTRRTITQYDGDRLVRSVAGNRRGDITTTFSYAATGQLLNTQSTTRDTTLNIKQSEVHSYFFRNDSLPEYAFIIRDNADTLHIIFKTDSLNLVTEEIWMRGKKEIERYYFYYDDKRHLTDIVRFNKKAGQLLPDYVFTYDEAGRLTKMIQVPRMVSKYITSEFFYDEKGLKLAENINSKDKQTSTRLTYRYQYW